MILLIFAALGLLLGLLTGGSVHGLSRYKLNGILLPIAALIVKSGAAALLTPQTGAIAVCLLQYALLFAFILLNARRPFWPLAVVLGSLLNMFVIVLNRGCMPVSGSLLGGSGARLSQLAQGRIYAYCLVDATSKLPFLGDIIRVGPAGVPLGFASVGDILLGVGVAILAYQMTKADSVRKKSDTTTL